MIDWSIVFPTRRRVPQLTALLQSLAETTERPERVEVLVAYDDDDAETYEFAHTTYCVPNVKFERMPQQGNMSDGYYTRLANMSTGRYVQALNDDVCFLTPSWDRFAVDAMDRAAQQHRPPAFYGRCEDGYGAFFACFPVLSRLAIDVQGYFFHPGFPGWGADVHLCRVWRSLDRVVDLPFQLHHDLPSESVDPDETHLRMRSITTYAHATTGEEAVRIERRLKEMS